jgi:hypothetical protein
VKERFREFNWQIKLRKGNLWNKLRERAKKKQFPQKK